MEIQWSLVLFSALVGAAGWMLAALAIDEVKGRSEKIRFTVAVVAVVMLVVGGIASVTHLSHPDRVMGALSHPTSDIFYEALLTGIAVICVVVYMILLKRGASAGARKGFAIAAAAVGIVLSFVSGLGYAVMDARYSWNTPLLPCGYLATSIPAGFGLYLAIALFGKLEKSDWAFAAKGTMIGGIVAAVVAAAYAVASGTAASDPIVIWGLVVIVGGIVPAAIGYLISKKDDGALPMGITACAAAFVGSIAFRCFMWMTTTVVANMFLQL